MANVTTVGRHTIQITGLDADWIMGTDTEFEHAYIESIQFIPSLAADRMIIHENGIDGPCFFDSGPAQNTGPIFERCGGVFAKLVIDISDCTLDTAASAKVLINIL